MRNAFIILVLLTLVGIQLQSCKDCEPVPASVNAMQVTFYDFDTLIIQNERKVIDRIYSEVSAIGTSSIFYDENTTLSSFPLVLSSANTSTTFTFEDSLGNIDSLQVNYEIETIVVGPDCGLYEVFKNVTVPFSTFDSVYVEKDKLELGDLLHLEVFD